MGKDKDRFEDTRVYSTQILFDREPADDGDAAARCDLMLAMEVNVEDDPFCAMEVRYFNVPDVVAHGIESAFRSAVKREIPCTLPLSYEELLKLEKNLLKLLQSLNRLGHAYRNKTRQEKREIDRDFVLDMDD